jgi:hypothetical protein
MVKKCRTGYIKADEKCEKVKHITINARRWFDRKNGNTYHSVEVHANGQFVGDEPFAYGYDDAYLQTAHEILQKAGIYKKTKERLKSGMGKDLHDFMMDMREHRSKFTKSVSDVSRKKDL